MARLVRKQQSRRDKDLGRRGSPITGRYQLRRLVVELLRQWKGLARRASIVMKGGVAIVRPVQRSGVADEWRRKVLSWRRQCCFPCSQKLNMHHLDKDLANDRLVFAWLRFIVQGVRVMRPSLDDLKFIKAMALAHLVLIWLFSCLFESWIIGLIGTWPRRAGETVLVVKTRERSISYAT